MKLKRFFSPEGTEAGGGDPAPEPVNDDGGEDPPAAPERPDGLADEFWDAESGVKMGDLIQSHTALSEAARERLANRPEEPSGYEFTVPDTYEDHEKLQELLGEDQPFLDAARKFLHSSGASQEQAAELFNLYLDDRVGSPERIKEAHTAEMAQLGDNAPQRIEAVSDWLNGHLGDEGYEAILAFPTTAASVKAMEKLMEANKDKPLPTGGDDGDAKDRKQVDPLTRATNALFDKTPKKG